VSVGVVGGCYAAAPADLKGRRPEAPDEISGQRWMGEADDAWSFVHTQTHPPWRGLAVETPRRHGVAFSGGDRSRRSAPKRGKTSPAVYRPQAMFYPNGHAAYHGVIAATPPRVITKTTRQTHHGERVNGTLYHFFIDLIIIYFKQPSVLSSKQKE
ncbi:MAG TPA: hypothetical protein VJ508_18540, partial [Saprospiraceae bacterium]|nr:hypothetical protein [Saprospiraceae bacterium]